MKRLILGTAGHIDHGKTALVQALTGIDTDRLPEEKQRGITIDLGFAHLEIGDLHFGIVDVPGHEDFIRNMLAGATGLDAVLLIVAADEGIMPQTREHLAILDLLNIQRGVVAITKTDLADPEWVELVAEDVRTLLEPTTLRGAPIVPVSARSGSGLEDLRNAIVQQATTSHERARSDLFRLPIDRVFTVRGTGTVVTGTVWSGRVTADAALRVLPADVKTRARGLQVHGAAVPESVAGERLALALSGVEKDAIERGSVVVDSAEWFATRMLTARVRVIPDTDWALELRQRVHVHLGTSEVLARAVLLDAEELNPGSEGWVQLRLEEPLVARVGDRVVLRSYSPVTTIGGGPVVRLDTGKRSEITAEEAALLQRVLEPDAERSVAAVIELRGVAGARMSELAVHTPNGPDNVKAALAALGEGVVRVGETWFARDVVEAAVAAVGAAITALHEAQPMRPTLERVEVRSALRGYPPELVEYAVEKAARRGQVEVRGSAVLKPGYQPRLTARQAALKETVWATIRSAGLAPPFGAELAQSLGSVDLEAVLRLLAAEGRIVGVAPDLYVDFDELANAERRTRRELGGQKVAAADFRAALPVTRKHLIPLLEYFDRTGVTRREGDLREVQPASEPS